MGCACGGFGSVAEVAVVSIGGGEMIGVAATPLDEEDSRVVACDAASFLLPFARLSAPGVSRVLLWPALRHTGPTLWVLRTVVECVFAGGDGGDAGAGHAEGTAALDWPRQ